MYNNRTQTDKTIKLTALIFSVLLNSGALVYFLLLEQMHTPHYSPVTAQEASIILQESQPHQQAQQEEWAQTYAKHSSFGLPEHSLEDHDAIIEPPDTIKEPEAQPQAYERPPATQESEPSLHEPTTTTRASGNTPLMTSLVTATKPKQTAQPQQPDAQKTQSFCLKDLAKGFLDHMHQKGNHAITMMGKKDAVPTDQQLKNERFLQKLNWHLYHAFRTNQTSMPVMGSQGARAQILLELNKDGSLHQLGIAQSSGNSAVDRFIIAMFQEASASFPPVPTYLPHNPYHIIYRVELMNEKGLSMGLSR